MLFCPPTFSQRSLPTSKGKINYYESTDQTPDMETLVFLHGFGGGSSSFEWSKVYPAFTSDYRVLAPDLVGWGLSEHLARDYTSFDYRQAISTHCCCPLENCLERFSEEKIRLEINF